jgi:hypothetical protein
MKTKENFIKFWLSDLKKLKLEKYSNSVFYIKDTNIVLEYNIENNRVYCYNLIYERLQFTYNLTMIESKEILEKSIKKFLNIKNIKMSYLSNERIDKIYIFVERKLRNL